MNIVYKGIEFPFRIKDSIKQRRIKLIKDTYKFYSENPDKVSVKREKYDKISCYYKSPDGNKCAVGRFIPDDEYSFHFENEYASNLLSKFNVHLQKLGSTFLNRLQKLHDDGFGNGENLEQSYKLLLEQYK